MDYYWGLGKMATTIVYWGYIGIMEKKMETGHRDPLPKCPFSALAAFKFAPSKLPERSESQALRL